MPDPVPAHCPACDKQFASMADVKVHLKKSLNEPEAIDYETHRDIYFLEGWDETPVTPT